MNLDQMSTKDLRALRDDVDAMIVQKQREARTTLRDTFRDLCRDAGTTLEDVLGTPRRGRRPKAR